MHSSLTFSSTYPISLPSQSLCENPSGGVTIGFSYSTRWPFFLPHFYLSLLPLMFHHLAFAKLLAMCWWQTLIKHVHHQLGAGERHGHFCCLHRVYILGERQNYLKNHVFKLELQTKKKSDTKGKVKCAVKVLNKVQERSLSWYFFWKLKKNVGDFLPFKAPFPWRSW